MSRPSGDAPWNWEFSNNASGTVVTPRGTGRKAAKGNRLLSCHCRNRELH